MRVLICGSRDWTDEWPIATLIGGLSAIYKDIVIIHGGATGADSIAGMFGDVYVNEVICEPADWKTHGRAAGPIRNQKMLDEHKPDVVYAFRLDGKSNGTDHMVKIARAARVPTYVVTMPRYEDVA